MEKKRTVPDPFTDCLFKARRCQREEAAGYYRLAVMLHPERKEGYLGLYDSLSESGPDADKARNALEDALGTVEYDRAVSNGESLRANPEEYGAVAFRLGRAAAS